MHSFFGYTASHHIPLVIAHIFAVENWEIPTDKYMYEKNTCNS